MLPKFGKFLVLYQAVVLWLNFTTQMTLCHLLPMPICPWIKYLSAKTTKYILKCWERSVRVTKNTSFDRRFLMVKTSIKTSISNYLVMITSIIWWWFLVPRSEHLHVRSATVSCKTQNSLTLSMLVPIHYNINSFFLKRFSLCPDCWSLIIKVLSELHFLLFNLITSKYSFFRRII